ncbi:hemerythrin domain-containing protein [Nitrospirillum viridazoti]|uniref:Hemerythrin HHE cation-binding protein n=1 Tax=Nitrospirillum viridazoti CBAmc TaxID=1441467 RepID=A0A248JYV0_9PROT|nr:hemerythrin domain-containing protein [Nitrospirillum amazonense]ASG23882.1 hemerythrin HHE cation-binding protein [Nitrospirillum amazonense CBAmc]TWB44691.1 hemerythrin HHE cation binding domain-containing protein [Nitrospirillum amazonense]
MDIMDQSRRSFLHAGSAGAVAAAGLALAGCGQGAGSEKDVGAVEDLMREHGVLRRVLFAYTEAATGLRGAATVDAGALKRAATLFRTFGEDYHERLLEEAHIFPAIRKLQGPVAASPDVLTAQHQRGREITDYILGVTGKGAIGTADREPMARAMETLVRMYRVHAAHEDTVVFTAWKQALSGHELDEMGDKFEEIERQQFGKDGFDDAVHQIADIEQALGLADIAQFTAPSPLR